MNTFVRVSLGMNNGIAVYLMAEVVDVKDTYKPYVLENGQTTKIRLDLAIGKSIKRFRISLISNRRITESEYAEYLSKLKLSNSKPKSIMELNEKRQSLKELTHNHKYTNLEIENMVNKKHRNKSVVTNHSNGMFYF